MRLFCVLGSVMALAGCSADKFEVADAAVQDAAPDAAALEAAAPDAGPSGTIICKGPRNCVTPSEACCLRLDQTDDQCIARPPLASTTCPNVPNSALLLCDDATDCAVGVCCADPTSNVFSSSCVLRVSCTGGDRLVLCDPAAVPSQCTSGTTCRPHPLIPRYSACQ